MYIKSIFVDGFKSYAKRTEIVGFDPAFNAITGLNGSGKSNILDAICFLLGITNLSQVRAANLQELIYKGGQAGITKATVSIVFDNKEKSCSPIGYENFDELTITRQILIGQNHKYLINGMTANKSRVQDLFRSVQLNVNNPHFLIMQGRITKVLNMKPPEILSLLEEAANTKHYETKREDTLKNIAKKDVKLRDIDKILKEDIKPTLARLNEERSSYLEYQKVVRELEYLNKFVVAYDYTKKKAIVDNSEGELNRMKEQHQREEQTISSSDAEKVRLEQQIDALCEERDTEHVVKCTAMEHQYSELLKEEAILKNAIGRAEDDLKEAKANVRSLEKQSKAQTDGLRKMDDELSQIQPQFESLRDAVSEAKSHADSMQQRVLDVHCGFIASETGGASGSLGELLAAAEKEESTLEMQLNVMRMKLTHHEKIVAQLETQLRTLHKNETAEQQEAQQRQLRAAIEKLDREILDTGFTEDCWHQTHSNKEAANARYQRCCAERDDIMHANRRLQFDYTKPQGVNFDERKIIGMVATLVRVTRPEFQTALEIASSSKLFSIIVADADTATKLFDGNCLRYRVTLLPLDSMRYEFLPDNVLHRARQLLGPDNVWSPTEAISFNKEYSRAVAYVFGGFLIARDMEMAKVVAFNDQVRCRCITLDGEILDPEGTLVGGYTAPSTGNVFESASKLADINRALSQLTDERARLNTAIDKLGAAQKRFRSLQNELRTRQLELTQVERRMMEDHYLEVQKGLTDTQAELRGIKDQMAVTDKAHREACARTKVALDNLNNAASVKERAQKEAEANWRLAQEKMNKAEEAFKEIEFRHETLTLEADAGRKAVDNLRAAIDNAKQREEELIGQLRDKNTALTEHSGRTGTLKAELEAQKRLIRDLEAQLTRARDRVKECVKERDQASLRLSEVVHRIACHRKDSEDAEIKVAKMLKKHAWIAEEAKHFNEPGSIYDFGARDWRQAEDNISKLEDQKRKLSRKVDLRGMNMLGQTEERYSDLMAKYQKVLQDKQKLHNFIDELDKLKVEVIKKAHEQVDRDFDKIFSTLLPGSQARLIPSEGKTIMEGLEFKIAFGNVWKDSLNELSGGQRSLVALSLILALLRFMPAPLYILDEVDAALDISHTNNIGTLIKEQFSNSQFIIVSLKDGMFNNANVLFKTKFVDGVSTVTRHVNVTRRPMAEKNN